MATRIVLVDDSEVALQWAVEHLEPFGFEVVTYNASLGIQAFVRQNQPKLVLLDVEMPALNGDLVCKMLKQNSHTKGIQVVLYSSKPESELQARASSVGADGYICKTADVQLLVEQIQAVIAD